MIGLTRAKEIVEKPETTDKLRRYKYIMGTLYNTEVSADYTFQEAYCEFYKLREPYSEKFKTKYFYILEEMKNASTISFRDALEKLLEVENNFEMSAASMLVNTVNPRFPVWDKFVAEEYFEMEEPSSGEASTEKCCKRYEDFSDKFYVYMNSPEGDALIKAFDMKFPNAEISDVSKMEFIIWMDQ